LIVTHPANAGGSNVDEVPCNGGELVYAPGDTRPVACVDAEDSEGNSQSWVRTGDMYVFANGWTLSPTLAWEDCPGGHWCFWEHANYTGLGCFFGSPTGQWFNHVSLCDEMMSSYRNRRDFDTKWAWGSLGGPPVGCVDSRSSNPYVGDYDNDQATSSRLFTNNTQC
jgi:hypothetical protein